MASISIIGTVGAGEDTITLANVPVDAAGNYHSRRIYRTAANPADPATATYSYLGTIDDNATTTFVDDGSAVPGAALNEDVIDGDYSYYMTFVNASGVESRPSPVIDAPLVSDGRLQLLNLPIQTQVPLDQWVTRNIYRNVDGGSTFYLIESISDANTPLNYTDNELDSWISNPANPQYKVLDFDGPQIANSTPLVNVIKFDGNSAYTSLFEAGTLSFTGKKGSRDLAAKEFTITATSTMGELVQFMEESMGIQTPPGPDATYPIPLDITGASAGGSIDSSGRIVFVSNNGADNAIGVSTGSLQLTTATSTQSVNMSFGSSQTAVGTSAVTDFIAYDSLGMSVDIRLTAILESQTSTQNIYRWFADSSQNQPASGVDIAVGTGLIYFDGDGDFDHATSDSMSIYRRDVPSASPLEVTIDFSELSGLGGSAEATLAVSRQDGSAPGTLTSFIIGEDGTIRGVFSNGITRDLGQIRLARFTNPVGLEQKGQNLFAAGVNSGLAIQGDPNAQGIGSVVTGATELSNTDIGSNLIDLILASTMYRGNTRVITTSQEMLEELLSLRR